MRLVATDYHEEKKLAKHLTKGIAQRAKLARRELCEVRCIHFYNVFVIVVLFFLFYFCDSLLSFFVQCINRWISSTVILTRFDFACFGRSLLIGYVLNWLFTVFLASCFLCFDFAVRDRVRIAFTWLVSNWLSACYFSIMRDAVGICSMWEWVKVRDDLVSRRPTVELNAVIKEKELGRYWRSSRDKS